MSAGEVARRAAYCAGLLIASALFGVGMAWVLVPDPDSDRECASFAVDTRTLRVRCLCWSDQSCAAEAGE